MAAGLAEEQLQGVGRRLDRLDWRRRLLSLRLALGLRLGEKLYTAPVELLMDRLDLELIELELLDDLRKLGLAQLTARLSGLEKHHELLCPENRPDLDGRQLFPLNTFGRLSRLRRLDKHARGTGIKWEGDLLLETQRRYAALCSSQYASQRRVAHMSTSPSSSGIGAASLLSVNARGPRPYRVAG